MSIKIKLIDPSFISVVVALMATAAAVAPIVLVADAAAVDQVDQVDQADDTRADNPAPPEPQVAPTLRLRCRYKGPAAAGEWLDSFRGRSAVDALVEVIDDFCGSVTDDDGTPVPCSRRAIAALLDQVKPAEGQNLFQAVVAAYLDALTEAASKN